MKVAEIVNGRRIMKHEPMGHFATNWWSVELRGAMFKGKPLEVWRRCETLADAVADAERLGPLTDAQEA